MRRVACVASVLAVLALLAPAGAQRDQARTPKEIMGVLNKGPTSVRSNIDMGLKADAPDWPAIQKLTKDYLQGVEDLGKATPPQGGRDTWAKFTRDFAALAKDLDAAAQKKDKTAALAVHDKMVNSCSDCHKVHRPK